MELNIILITQARMGSSRLPGKVLREINGTSLLKIQLTRLKKVSLISDIIVATTLNIHDSIIFNRSIQWGFSSTRGSESDVLDRFYQSVKNKNADWIVRVTSDCPLIDPILIDKVILYATQNNVDYCSNTLLENFPDGQDIEVFKFSALEVAWQNAFLKSDREHVTPFIKKNSDFNRGNLFKAKNYNCFRDYSKIRMTVDEESDFKLIKRLIEDLGVNENWETYAKHIIDNNLITVNAGIIRNDGYIRSLKNDN
jgi:spore coat polysaccharide biosynthesis protein SpsF